MKSCYLKFNEKRPVKSRPIFLKGGSKMKARYIVCLVENNQFGKLASERISCDTLQEAKDLKAHFEKFESVQYIEIIYYISRPYKSYSKTIEKLERWK